MKLIKQMNMQKKILILEVDGTDEIPVVNEDSIHDNNGKKIESVLKGPQSLTYFGYDIFSRDPALSRFIDWCCRSGLPQHWAR